jgi:hypothetical protein
MSSTELSEAPLTFGQLSVWRDIDRLPRARWQEANMSNTFGFPEPVSRRRLCQALTRLQAKHGPTCWRCGCGCGPAGCRGTPSPASSPPPIDVSSMGPPVVGPIDDTSPQCQGMVGNQP